MTLEYFNLRQKELIDNIPIKLSCSLGYHTICDFVLCDRFYENSNLSITEHIKFCNNLKNNDKLFLNYSYVEKYIREIIKIFKNNNVKLVFFILVEPNAPNWFIELLLPYTIEMFIQNNIYNHPNVHVMPIGLRDPEEVHKNHKGFSHKYIIEEKSKHQSKEYLCYLTFSYNHYERNRCETILGNKDFVVNLNNKQFEKQPSIHCGKVPVWINYEYTHKSYFVLSPRGYGEDCHRFFESIYLDSIPIVKRTNTVFDKLYYVFPCLVVDDWNEVTKDFLEENKEPCFTKLNLFKTNYPNAFTDLNSIYELLKKL